MYKYLFIIGVSFGCGVAASRYISPVVKERVTSAAPALIPPPPPPSDTTAANELAAARAEIAQLQEQIKDLQKNLPRGAPPIPPVEESTRTGTTQTTARPAPNAPPSRTAWRISAIEKFVPLSEEQRSRLTVKFAREAAGEESAESLDEILGIESAAFYREQVKAAFDRARSEEVDREIVWLGRQLALTPAQERDIKAAFDAVETELDTLELPESVGAKTPEERVKAMIAENKRREDLRQERLKTILTPDQFTAYSRVQAESTQSDIEVFHGAN